MRRGLLTLTSRTMPSVVSPCDGCMVWLFCLHFGSSVRLLGSGGGSGGELTRAQVPGAMACEPLVGDSPVVKDGHGSALCR